MNIGRVSEWLKELVLKIAGGGVRKLLIPAVVMGKKRS